MRTASAVVVLALTFATVRAASGESPEGGGASTVADSLVPQSAEQWVALGRSLYGGGRYREAVAAFERGVQLDANGAPTAAWNIARSYARLGNRKQALRWLAHARDYGFRDARALLDDAAFDRFRNDAGFKDVLSPSSCVSSHGRVDVFRNTQTPERIEWRKHRMEPVGPDLAYIFT